MSHAEYRAFLITGILSLQRNEGWTLDDLMIRPTHNLERLYHFVTAQEETAD